MSAPAIEVRDLHMRYGDAEAVRGIDLEVATGEVFGFLGPNGAGKTTTIEILEGYRARTGGRGVGARCGPRDSRRARGAIGSGLVLQACELDPLLTVRETLFACSPASTPRRGPSTRSSSWSVSGTSATSASAGFPVGSAAASTWVSR